MSKAEREEEPLDLDGIEATLEQMPRIPRFPAYFTDMRLLVAEVKWLRSVVDSQEDKINELERVVILYRDLYEVREGSSENNKEAEIEGVPV